jgi:hypothetical protein
VKPADPSLLNSGVRDWRPALAVPPLCPHRHSSQPGVVDERARRLSHEEMAVATRLAAEGHRVRSLSEGRSRSPVADLEACGVPVEVKSWLSLAERGGRAPTPRSVVNKLLDAGRQAPAVVLNGYGSGLTAGVARRGMALYAARPDAGSLTSVRVLGDGFDLAWARRRQIGFDREVGPGREGVTRRVSNAGPQAIRDVRLGL